jgi:hypothetical protein
MDVCTICEAVMELRVMRFVRVHRFIQAANAKSRHSRHTDKGSQTFVRLKQLSD